MRKLVHISALLAAALGFGGVALRCTLPAPPPLAAPAWPEVATPGAPAPPPRREEITWIAGGDVCFGRALGQRLLSDPAYDAFASISPLLATADVRFVNLESQLSDQGGETQSPLNFLVFTGPPAGADALSRARIDIVSVANNHMWDYGKKAFFETLGHLERAGVAYAGAGHDREQAQAAAIVEREGFRVAVLAVTDIWNQGPLRQHPARDHVAGADAREIAAAVRAARADPTIDAVLVSYHGGEEYLEPPLTRARTIAQATIDAGADAFLGHHPHVLQGVEIRTGRPIFYSLGNFLMGVNQSHPETGLGMLARLRLRRGHAPGIEICPFRIVGLEAIPLARDPRRAALEVLFSERMRRLNSFVAGAPALGRFGDDGCAPLSTRYRPDPG